jgi:hypothetical protein
MRRVATLFLLLAVQAQPALAGHGTIEETETEIYVEYSGDANDKPADAVKPGDAGRATAAAKPADTTQPTAAALFLKGTTKPGVDEATLAQQDEARMQASEARAEQRRQDAELRRQELDARAQRRNSLRTGRGSSATPNEE